MKRRAEPVVLLALVEHDLERAQAQRQQPEADIVDPQPLAQPPRPLGHQRRRVVDHALRRAAASTTPTGTLMKKTQRQAKLSVIQPPSVGPIAGATTTAMP